MHRYYQNLQFLEINETKITKYFAIRSCKPAKTEDDVAKISFQSWCWNNHAYERHWWLTDSINDLSSGMNIHIRANCEHFDQIRDAWNEDRRCDGRIHASGIYGAASCSITSHGWHGWGGEENRELEPATTFSVPRGEYFCVLLVEELSILVIRDGGRWSGGGEQPPLIHRIDDGRVARNRVSSFASKNRILLKRNAYFPLLISISFSSFLDLVTSFCW